jgi:hypothetical protein
MRELRTRPYLAKRCVGGEKQRKKCHAAEDPRWPATFGQPPGIRSTPPVAPLAKGYAIQGSVTVGRCYCTFLASLQA